jgi:hypothetical protein
MTATDTRFALIHGLAGSSPHKNISALEFANRLALDLINMSFSTEAVPPLNIIAFGNQGDADAAEPSPMSV